MDTKNLEALSEPDKWRVVYEIWATEGNQNDRETAEITGVPRSSINYHRRMEGWARRFREEYLGLSNADIDVARIRWKRLLVDGMGRMEHIVSGKVVRTDPFGNAILDAQGQPEMIYAAKDSDAVSAYRAVMDTVTNRDMGSQTESYEGAITSISEGSEVDDPALLATRILEDIQHGVNTRTMVQSRRGRRV
jgi:hypothetical protein